MGVRVSRPELVTIILLLMTQLTPRSTLTTLASPFRQQRVGFRAMPIGTIETIIQRIRELVYGRANGMSNSLVYGRM
jgi:hypothetical protein